MATHWTTHERNNAVFMSDKQQSSECTTHRKRYSLSLEYFTVIKAVTRTLFRGKWGFFRPITSFHFSSLPSLFSSLSPLQSAPQIQLISQRAVSSPASENHICSHHTRFLALNIVYQNTSAPGAPYKRILVYLEKREHV